MEIMMEKLGTLLNRILCKPHDVTYRITERVTVAIAHFLVEAFFITIASVVIVSALFLWLYVPCFACIAMFGDDVNSIWQLYALFGIFGAWIILSKIVYDRLGKKK